MTQQLDCNQFRWLSSQRHCMFVAMELVDACLRHVVRCPHCEEWLAVEDFHNGMTERERLELRKVIKENSKT